MTRSVRLFLFLSLMLLISDLVFVWINYRSASSQFEASMREQAAQQRSAYQLALEMEQANLLKLAQLVATDRTNQKLFLLGKQAVVAEGGGPGGERANQYRQQLLRHIQNSWQRLRDEFGMRQLHFHIGPGSLSFLRAHKTPKYGDRMDDLRHIIVDTNADGQSRTGFETGRVYSGLRGVAPVFATDPDTGERSQVGAVEVGASFDHVLEIIDRQTGSGVAALLLSEHVKRKMWQNQIEEVFDIRSEHCGCLVDASSRSDIAKLLSAHGDLPAFKGAPFLLTYTPIENRLHAVTHIPLQDYLGSREADPKPVGRILMWRDVTDEQALFEQAIRTAVIYAIFGFLLVELLLFWAVRMVTRHLQREIDDQTRQLRDNHRELLQLKNAAETANRAKSAFLANMSHELRTPLNAVLGYAQILQHDSSLDGAQRHAIDTIRHGGDYLLTLVNDVLDLAKIEAGRFELNPGPCRTRGFFSDIAELFRARTSQKGLEFHFELAANLPAVIEIDEKRLRQIVLNLLGNAVKFTEQGSVGLQVERVDEQLWVSVSDSGIGIPPERIDTLFQPFSQLGHIDYKQQGTGLGLTISQTLSKQMGGSIQVESTPDKGSRFRLQLPLIPLEEREAASKQDEFYPQVRGYRRLDGKTPPIRLLAADDTPPNREVLIGLLEPLGFVVDTAADGAEALQHALAEPPDLILMDLMMPGLDGLQAVRRIHEHARLRETPVIICSARAFEEDRQNSIAAGCADHIATPVQADHLLQVLERHLPLEWRMAEPDVTPQATGHANFAMPPALHEHLSQLVRRGDIMELSKEIADLIERHGPDPLLHELQQACHGFDMVRIRSLLKGVASKQERND